MSWAMGLAAICVALVIIYVAGEVLHDFGPGDDIDHVAERKRMNARNARRQSGEFQEPRL
jgi:hypothetical protein